MKQDLEKAENAYLSNFTSKKSKTLPGATAAAHGDPNGKNDYQKKGDLKPITNMKMSLATEDKSCPVEGIGTLRFRVKYKGSFHEITLTDVLFNPKLRRNLLSGSRLESKGAHFVGTKDGIKTLLKSSEVPHKFWGEALLCFTYAWNRICHKDRLEKYSGRKPSVLHLIPFGCLAYAGVPKQIRKKFDMRAKMGIMMGYAQRTKGYRIWLIDENKLVETINVIFDENKRGVNFRQKVNSNLGYNLNLPDYYDDEDDFDRVKDSLTSRLVSKTSTETPSTSEKPDVFSDNHSLIPCTEVKWIRNIGRKVTGSNVYYSIEGEATRLKSFNEIERYYLSEQQEALMVEVTIPNCYKQAIRSRDVSKWHDAMDKEINVMK
ncbi:retrovirus-related Pol polyprotein from transposon RE1 [Trichonephila clavipes]|nr:retrovirus-related Pol polyprotein from transposon RE1 [Trichonephila clavipes]